MHLTLEAYWQHTIYAFMRFPRGCAARSVSVNLDNKQAKLVSSDIELPTSIGAVNINLLEKIIGFTKNSVNNGTVSNSDCDDFPFSFSFLSLVCN